VANKTTLHLWNKSVNIDCMATSKGCVDGSAWSEGPDGGEYCWQWALVVYRCRTCSCRRETSVTRCVGLVSHGAVTSELLSLYAVYACCTLDLVDCRRASASRWPGLDVSMQLSIHIPCIPPDQPVLGSTSRRSPTTNTSQNQNSVLQTKYFDIYRLFTKQCMIRSSLV